MWVDVGSIFREFKKYAITAGIQTKFPWCLPLGQIAVRIKEVQYASKRKI